jgi:hypothetical protein
MAGVPVIDWQEKYEAEARQHRELRRVLAALVVQAGGRLDIREEAVLAVTDTLTTVVVPDQEPGLYLRLAVTPDTRQRCPDGGTCHHSCKSGALADCERVRTSGPLTGVYSGDKWPAL